MRSALFFFLPSPTRARVYTVPRREVASLSFSAKRSVKLNEANSYTHSAQVPGRPSQSALDGRLDTYTV